MAAPLSLEERIEEAAYRGTQRALKEAQTTTPPAEALVDKQTASGLLNVSSATLDRMIARGEVPFVKVGDSKRFCMSDVLAALKGAA